MTGSNHGWIFKKFCNYLFAHLFCQNTGNFLSPKSRNVSISYRILNFLQNFYVQRNIQLLGKIVYYAPRSYPSHGACYAFDGIKKSRSIVEKVSNLLRFYCFGSKTTQIWAKIAILNNKIIIFLKSSF